MAPAAKHRESLVTSSIALFQRQGYAATGLAEILAESGAPRGSLYHYFPDGKEAIAEAAVREAAARTEQRIREAAARFPDPTDFVNAYAAALAQMMGGSEFRRGCPIATVALEAAPQSDRLTAATRDALGGWCAAIADMLLAAGVEAGRADELADFMMSAFQGAMILARVRQSTTPILRAAQDVVGIFQAETTQPAPTRTVS